MDFNDYRAKISIEEMAEFLGYRRISTPNARHLEYILDKEDEIVIYPNGKGYFSRRGDDKGDLIKFVLYRLNRFNNCTESGFKGVNEVLSKYLGSDLKINHLPNRNQAQESIPFNINKCNPRPVNENTFNYLKKKRYLSKNTIDDFKNRLHIYTVGSKDNTGFPFRKPGQMEITNFEMRNYDPASNVNFKGFCIGGDKSNSCWIANFVPFDKVTDICLFESAIDAMSFYEIKHFTKETTCAFISTGGNVTKNQIENINAIFPNTKIKWHCAYDKDGSGNGFDVITAYYLNGEDCKVFKRTVDNEIMIFISFPTGESLSVKESEFSSIEFLKSRGKDRNIDIIKPPKYKDWNELLVYYKRFELNLGPGMKFLPIIDNTISQLNLRGYHQFTDSIKASKQEFIDSLLKQTSFGLSAPLAESKAYILMVDCNIFMGIDSMVPIPSNLYIIDKTTQKTISAYSMNEFLKKEYINIFRDLTSDDFKNLLEKHTLTYTQGSVEKSFERIISASGWNLKAATSLKKKDLDIEQDL